MTYLQLLLRRCGEFKQILAMAFDGSVIYQVANDLGFDNLNRVARRAGVMSVLQVTAYYSGRRVRHSVARVIEYQLGEVELLLVYEGFNRHKPLRLSLPKDRLEKLVRALRQAKFDTLRDQDGLSFTDRGLWLIQRAAGTYSHGVIVAPDKPQLPWSAIVNAIDDYLPSAIREVPLRN